MQEAPGDMMERVKRFSHGQEGSTRVSGTSATTARDLSLSSPLRHISADLKTLVAQMEELGVIQICSTLVITKVPYHSTNPEPPARSPHFLNR